MRRLVYNVVYSAAPINSSLLTITLFPSVKTTLVYNDKIHCYDVIIEFDCIMKKIAF